MWLSASRAWPSQVNHACSLFPQRQQQGQQQQVTSRWCSCVPALALQLRIFFGNPDALHASFWPAPNSNSSSPYNGTAHNNQQKQQDHQQSNGVDHQQQDNSNSSNTIQPSQQQEQQRHQLSPVWLQIDAAAVQELHERLQAIHADSVRDAVMEGSQVMLLHLSDCAQKNVDNPGFTRQVKSRRVLYHVQSSSYHVCNLQK